MAGDARDPNDLATARTAPLSSGERADSPPLFQLGDRVGGRYLIERYVAQGGMGQVYVARDTELGASVALKTLRPDLQDPESIAAFKREMLLARRVTHPNVCRLFDVGYHELEGGQKVVFLTMELLDGPTLAEHLAKAGPLGADAALALVRPLVAALRAAHEAGVAHRDFKAENVVVVRAAGGPPRVVVTDFGMAGLTSERRGDDVVGSVSTIAPEQLRGGAVDERADVYALGVVLYQIRTGRLPFTGATPLEVAMARLDVAPPPPGLGEPWDGVILGCLAREPGERTASVGAVLAALEPARASRRRTTLLLGLAGAVALGVGGLVVATRREHPPAVAVAARRVAVAVVGFADLSGRADDAWLGTALVEMAAAELVAGGKLRVVSADTVARARAELALPPGSVPDASRERARMALGADYFVGGTYLATPAHLRIDAVLVDARTGETVDAASVEGAPGELSALTSRACVALRARLGVGPTDDAARQVAASMPHDPQAARDYAEGLASLRAFDLAAARDHVEAAVAREPGHALSWLALADVRARLQDVEGARAAGERAWQVSADLPREHRMVIEALHFTGAHEDEKAAELSGALFRFYPDDLDHGLRYVAALIAAHHEDEAYRVLDELRRLPAPARDDPRIDLAEASAAGARVDYARARAATQRAAARAKAQGASLVYAEARRLEGWAARNLGDLDGAEAAASEAAASFQRAGNRASYTACLETLGEVYAKRGQLRRIEAVAAERARAWKELGNERLELVARGSGAAARAGRGEPAPARDELAAVSARMAALGNDYGHAVALTQLAEVERTLGQLDAARGHAAEAMASSATKVNRRLLAFTQTVAGDVALARGELDEAERLMTAALAIRDELKLALPAAQTRLGLARLALARGRVDEGVALAQAALDVSATQGAVDDEASAMTVLARALARKGQHAEARALLAKARARATASENVETHRELDRVAAGR